MSKSKYDLIVRTRYQNQIPAPKFGPKLINIEPNLQRLGDYNFTADLVAEQPHAMLADAESGMPLQLQHFAELWDDHDEDDEHIHLNPEADVELDDDDLALLVDPADVSLRGNTTLNSGTTTPDKPSQASNKAWLYKSKYSNLNASEVNEKRTNYSKAALSRKQSSDVRVYDDTPEGRAQEIESTFQWDTRQPSSQELSEITHPQKKHLKAVDTYDFLPDFETFANDYFLMRFADDPSDRTTSSDHRLHNGILRPRYADNGETWLQYYLPESDEQYALLRSKLEAETLPEDVDEQQRVIFNYIREYNVTNEQKDTNDILLMFDNGDSKPPGSTVINPSLASARPRGKGVYYKHMPTRMTLKKRRPKDEEDEDMWDKIQLGLEPLNEEEVSERMAIDDYFMPAGPQRAKEKKEEQRQMEDAAKEEEKLRIKSEKIQHKQDLEKERKAAMEEQIRREEEDKIGVNASKSDESEDEEFGDKEEEDEDKDGDESKGNNNSREKEVPRSSPPGSDDGEHDNVTSEAASKEIDEAIRREIDQRQTGNDNRDVNMRSASPPTDGDKPESKGSGQPEDAQDAKDAQEAQEAQETSASSAPPATNTETSPGGEKAE
ncbi:hypothetical protein E3P77_00730 [Wallemia ichthyophaga]|nr:hypothetical protein E3P77_00730 [Wallemia ichthyophaga]